MDDYRLNLKLKVAEIFAAHLMHGAPCVNTGFTRPTITDAFDPSHPVECERKCSKFFAYSNRAVDYSIQSLGCRLLNQYASADAYTGVSKNASSS